MSSQHGDIDEHIDRLKNGGTLTENEVKNLCEKVRGILRWRWMKLVSSPLHHYPSHYGKNLHLPQCCLLTKIILSVPLTYRPKKFYNKNLMCSPYKHPLRFAETFMVNFMILQNYFALEDHVQTPTICSWEIMLIEAIILWRLSLC